MANQSNGANNQPLFTEAGAPELGTDLNLVSNYAAKTGNRRVGTTTERNAATGSDVWEGLEWYDTTDTKRYIRRGGAWKNVETIYGAGNTLNGGAPPAGTTFLTQAGTGSVSLNVNGDGTLTYPYAFPNGVLSVVLQRYDYTYYGATEFTLSTNQAKTGVNFRVYDSTGVVVTGITIWFTYIAIGW